MLESLIYSFYAFFIYADAWGPVLIPDIYPYIEKWFPPSNARLQIQNEKTKVVLPNSTFKITDGSSASPDSLWQHILLLITDNWFFNWLSDQVKLPENKDNKITLNHNIVKDMTPVKIEELGTKKPTVSKIEKHSFSKII